MRKQDTARSTNSSIIGRQADNAYAVMDIEMLDPMNSRGMHHANREPRRAARAGGTALSAGAAIGWITWVLILSGVSLNAAAQLLLKSATGRSRSIPNSTWAR